MDKQLVADVEPFLRALRSRARTEAALRMQTAGLGNARMLLMFESAAVDEVTEAVLIEAANNLATSAGLRKLTPLDDRCGP